MPLAVALDTTSLAGPRTGIAAFVAHVLDGLGARDDVTAVRYRVSWRLGPSEERWIRWPAQLLTRTWRWSDRPRARVLADTDLSNLAEVVDSLPDW